MICSLPGLSTLSDARMARPMNEDEERDQRDEHQVIRHMDVQRREQEIDERDERGRVFKRFHSGTLYNVSQVGLPARATLEPSQTKGGSFDPPSRLT